MFNNVLYKLSFIQIYQTHSYIFLVKKQFLLDKVYINICIYNLILKFLKLYATSYICALDSEMQNRQVVKISDKIKFYKTKSDPFKTCRFITLPNLIWKSF